MNDGLTPVAISSEWSHISQGALDLFLHSTILFVLGSYVSVIIYYLSLNLFVACDVGHKILIILLLLILKNLINIISHLKFYYIYFILLYIYSSILKPN